MIGTNTRGSGCVSKPDKHVAKKGKPQPWAIQIGKSHKGIKRSPEFKAKVSAGMVSYIKTLPAGEMTRRQRFRKQRKGYKVNLTPEQRQHRSESARAGAIRRYSDPEQRRLTAERTKESWKKRSRKFSEDAKRRISEGVKRYIATLPSGEMERRSRRTSAPKQT